MKVGVKQPDYLLKTFWWGKVVNCGMFIYFYLTNFGKV